MKKALLLKPMLLLFALIVGSSSVWADDILVETLDFTSSNTNRPGISAYGTESTWGNWSIVGAANNNKGWDYLRIGGGKKNDSPSTITRTTSGVAQAVDYIEINHEGRSSSNFSISSITVEASNSTDFTSPTATKTVSNPDISSAGKITISFDSQVAANSYYKITINWSNTSSSSNAGLNTDNVLFYKKSSDPSSEVSFANTTPSINFPATTTYSQTATTASGYTGTVSYEITTNTAGATINGSTVTVTQEGSVTVKATAPAVTGFSASSATYTLTVNDTRSDNGLAFSESEQEVVIGETLTAPTLTNPNNLMVTYSSSNTDIATVDASGNVTGVATGAATITATFGGNDNFKPGSASYTIKVKKALPAGTLFWESMSGYTSTSDSSTELTTSYTNLDSDNWEEFTKVYPGKKLSNDADGHLKFGSGSYAGEAVTKSISLTGNGKLTYKVQRYDSSNAGNLKISVTGATATGDVDVTGTAEWVEKTVYLTKATGSVVITFETTSSNKRIRVDDIMLVEVTAESATIASSGYTTFCSPFDLSFENVDGLNAAYVVSQSTDAVATLKKVTAVPAGTGVVLKGTAGPVSIPVVEYTGDVISNLLEGTLEETPVEAETVYVVSGGKFMLFAGTSIPAHKAYLPVSAIGEGAPSLSFEFDDETTGIQNIERNINDNQYYTLDGRRVAEPTKGLYILNGKKVVVK